jgi:hypothetical protein
MESGLSVTVCDQENISADGSRGEKKPAGVGHLRAFVVTQSWFQQQRPGRPSAPP